MAQTHTHHCFPFSFSEHRLIHFQDAAPQPLPDAEDAKKKPDLTEEEKKYKKELYDRGREKVEACMRSLKDAAEDDDLKQQFQTLKNVYQHDVIDKMALTDEELAKEDKTFEDIKIDGDKLIAQLEALATSSVERNLRQILNTEIQAAIDIDGSDVPIQERDSLRVQASQARAEANRSQFASDILDRLLRDEYVGQEYHSEASDEVFVVESHGPKGFRLRQVLPEGNADEPEYPELDGDTLEPLAENAPETEAPSLDEVAPMPDLAVTPAEVEAPDMGMTDEQIAQAAQDVIYGGGADEPVAEQVAADFQEPFIEDPDAPVSSAGVEALTDFDASGYRFRKGSPEIDANVAELTRTRDDSVVDIPQPGVDDVNDAAQEQVAEPEVQPEMTDEQIAQAVRDVTYSYDAEAPVVEVEQDVSSPSDIAVQDDDPNESTFEPRREHPTVDRKPTSVSSPDSQVPDIVLDAPGLQPEDIARESTTVDAPNSQIAAIGRQESFQPDQKAESIKYDDTGLAALIDDLYEQVNESARPFQSNLQSLEAGLTGIENPETHDILEHHLRSAGDDAEKLSSLARSHRVKADAFMSIYLNEPDAVDAQDRLRVAGEEAVATIDILESMSSLLELQQEQLGQYIQGFAKLEALQAEVQKVRSGIDRPAYEAQANALYEGLSQGLASLSEARMNTIMNFENADPAYQESIDRAAQQASAALDQFGSTHDQLAKTVDDHLYVQEQVTDVGELTEHGQIPKLQSAFEEFAFAKDGYEFVKTTAVPLVLDKSPNRPVMRELEEAKQEMYAAAKKMDLYYKSAEMNALTGIPHAELQDVLGKMKAELSELRSSKDHAAFMASIKHERPKSNPSA